MHLILLILFHFIIYSIPPILGSLLDEEGQVYLNYIYLGILFTLTQLLDSLYAIEITNEFFMNAGDISYSALIFSTIYLIISRPDPKVVRNLIYINFILSVFLFFLFIFLNSLLTWDNILNYNNISEMFLEFSYRSLLFSFFLYSSETVLILFLSRFIIKKYPKRLFIAIGVSIIYFMVLILDGVIYPTGINIIFPNSHFSVKYGIFAKIIFGFGFGIILTFLTLLNPNKFNAFLEYKTPFRNYILPPRQKELQQKIKMMEEEIGELRQILPICSHCKKIRDDEGYWNQLEQYLLEHNDVTFSHGICPDCEKKLFAMNAETKDLEKLE